MNRMIRTFMPIGQGAFYCEEFTFDGCDEKINIVYDCGGNDATLVEHYIKDNFDEGETIHALFISHLHEDHINGVPELLKHCKVKNIFFPLLTGETKTLSALYNTVIGTKSSFSASFAMDPMKALEGVECREKPNLYQVLEADAKNQDDTELRLEQEEINTINSGADVSSIIINSVGTITGVLDDWVFVPFHFREQKKLDKLKAALKKEFKKDMNNEDLKNIWESANPDEIAKMRSAYDQVASNHNIYSMTLYSGVENDSYRQKMAPYHFNTSRWYYCCRVAKRNVGCLYMGDYDAHGNARWASLKKAYQKYWGYIGCVQIPHHGSRYNYNTELADLNAFSVISVRTHDISHPAPSVVKDLLLKGRAPFIVTEDCDSILHLVVDIW